MTDLRPTIIPKSDQLNADDLIGGPLTITVTKVSANPSSAEQPIAIAFEGDGGKPYFPCKSMRRVLVNTWGHDGNTFPGRSMTLYRDDKVQFGGLAVGGIRISHLSHIDKEVTMALTATRANRKPFTVKPLKIVEPAAPPPPTGVDTSWLKPLDEPNGAVWIKNLAALLASAQSQDEVIQIGGHNSVGNATAKAPAAVRARISEMLATAFGKFSEPVIDGPMFDEPASDEPLPEVAIAGEAKMAAG